MSIVSGKNRIYKQKVWIGFLMSYIIMLILPLIVGSLLYKETLKIVKEDAKETNLSILEQSREVIEKSLTEVDALVMQLAMNTEINSLVNLNRELEGRDINKVVTVTSSLKPYVVANKFINTFHIYIKKPNIVLTSNASYINKKFFYGQAFKYSGMEESEWDSTILDKRYDKAIFPETPVIINGREHSAIAYAQSLPLADWGEPKGTILVLIDKSQFQKLLKRLYIGEHGWAYIMDESGRIITSVSPKDKEINYPNDVFEKDRGFVAYKTSDKDMTISYTTSSYNGWRYVAAVPTDMIMGKVKYIQRITIGITVTVLMLGLIIAFLLAYSKSKPIKDIVGVLRDNIGGDIYRASNEYDFLKGSIARLLDDNKDMQLSIQQQLPILESAFTERLLKGEFSREEEIQSFLGQIGKNFECDMFMVMIMYISEEYNDLIYKDIVEEMNIKRIVIKDYLDKSIGKNNLLHYMDDDKIVILLGSDFHSTDSFTGYAEALIEKSYRELYERYRIHVFYTVGGTYQSLIDVFRSFDDAKRVSGYKQIGSSEKAVWYDRVPKRNDNYCYTIEMELRLMNKVKAGSESEVRKNFEILYEENFIKRKLSITMLQQLMTEIHGTVIKLLEEVRINDKEVFEGIKDAVKKFDPSKSINKTYGSLMQFCLDICNVANDQKKSYNSNLTNSIISHINSSYMDQDICLTGVAEKFQISETYLSHFFKEQTGENFFNYLEGIRQKTAQKLLTQTNLSVDEVAKRVGYSNSDTFRKAFKRFYGMSPVNYRKGINRTSDE